MPTARCRRTRGMVFDQGAYQLTTLPPTVFLTIVRVAVPGRVPVAHLEFESKVVATNKATYVAYRGPWEAETWVRERMLDEIAADIGLPPEVVRRRNLLASDEFPTRLATDVSFAHVTARETFEAAMARDDPDGFRRDQEQARAAGRYRGFGFATFVEPSPVHRTTPGRWARAPRPGPRSGRPPASSPTARSPSSPASRPTARVTTPRWPSWPPTSSACRSRASASSPATPR